MIEHLELNLGSQQSIEIQFDLVKLNIWQRFGADERGQRQSGRERGVVGQDLIQEWDCGPGRQFQALDDRVLPELFEGVAEALAHFEGDVGVDGVHAGHGVAAAVHLDDLVQVGGF